MTEYIEEGGAKIAKEDDTFFNPAQQLNRDLSAEVIKSYFGDQRRITVLDAMSATGLRGIRYLREIPNARVIFNDISPQAVETIKRNLEMNRIRDYVEVPPYPTIRNCSARACVTASDCLLLMHQNGGHFDVVDIDTGLIIAGRVFAASGSSEARLSPSMPRIMSIMDAWGQLSLYIILVGHRTASKTPS